MGMRGIIRSFGGSANGSNAGGRGRLDPSQRYALFEQFEEVGIVWLWASDADGCLTYLSQSALERVGGEENFLGAPLTSLFELENEGDADSAERPLRFLLSAHQKIGDLLVRVSRAKGDRDIWWKLSGQAQFNSHGQFIGYRGSASDVTEEFERRREETRAAQYDQLTGLANRSRMSKRLSTTLTAFKAAQRSCALIMVDLDRFKQVNDTLGHPAGDDLLKQVAQRLERIVGQKGEIARVGGDEFQIMLPDIDDRGTLGALGQRIIQMLSQPYSVEGKRAIIGTSAGIAIAPYDGIEPNELVKNADLALYAAKGGGRGQYRFYSAELQDAAQNRRQIEEDLRDALAKGELEMHYQPSVNAKTNCVTGFEALMRWDHPERGPISPSVFIPIAEESNLISALGEWALRQACEDAVKWPGKINVAVNVSTRQFDSDSLPKIVAQVLSSTGLDPRRLELEITESVFMGDAESVDRIFSQLKKLGVKLSLDDFGTGYSSLGYLRKAPFHKIKIDQSFVRGCTEEGNSSAAIITAIVSLADAMGMETTAEGVEAMDELDLVRERGATNVQGFIFSRAIPHDKVLEKLENGNLVYEPVGPSKHRPERRSLYRRVGVIHEDHRYEAMMRDLSKTGARIEGLLDVPVGTELVLDLGEGQLAVCSVRRSQDATQGVEFETPLISDGADGLCTRHRVSPYLLAAAGMPLAALPKGNYPLAERAPVGTGAARFLQVDIGSGSSRAA